MPRSMIPTETLDLKLTDKKVVVAGKFPFLTEDMIRAVLTSEGATLTGAVTKETDYVFVGWYGGKAAVIKQVEALNKKGAAITIVENNNFFEFFVPDKNALIKLFKGGDSERCKLLLMLRTGVPGFLDLTNSDFNDQMIEGIPLAHVDLTGSTFRNATVKGAQFFTINKLEFKNAKLDNIAMHGAKECSFKGATMSNISILGALTRCDLSDAGARTFFLSSDRVEETKFTSSKFSNASFQVGKFANCDFTNCEFEDVLVYQTVFSDCKFNAASLKGCWFIDCKFEDCDLSNCDFSGANLALTSLETSRVDKANFTGCNLDGAECAGLEKTSAIALGQILADTGKKTNIESIPSVVQLSQDARACSKFELSFQLRDQNKSHLDVSIASAPLWVGGVQITITDPSGGVLDSEKTTIAPIARSLFESGMGKSINVASVSVAMRFIALVFSCYEPVLPTVATKLTKGQVSSKEFQVLVMRALSECFGLDLLTDKEYEKLLTSAKKSAVKEKEELLVLLKSGPEGVARYNERVAAGKRPSLRGVDLSGADLTGVDFRRTDLANANLEGCNLTDAFLTFATINGASFKNAILKNTSAQDLNVTSCDFSGATIEGASFERSKLQQVNFSGSHCSAVNFARAVLLSANFIDAKMQNTHFEITMFDPKTFLPNDVIAHPGLVWTGTGPHPAKLQEFLQASPSEPLDFAKFLERLESSIDVERLKKALKMLKAEQFQLFAEVKDNQMVGVVKSQTDPDLVYACILTDEGKFCCGTQNLNSCGGLRGALCKHLLVLLLGLTKAEQLDANAADKWARASKLQQPKMDKDVLSETFLRYKGAEAGEIDWRPTETIPEDYYAF